MCNPRTGRTPSQHAEPGSRAASAEASTPPAHSASAGPGGPVAELAGEAEATLLCLPWTINPLPTVESEHTSLRESSCSER